MASTQESRRAYREVHGGYWRSGASYGKPYLADGWRWARVPFLAGGSSYPGGVIMLRVHPVTVDAFRALASVFYYHEYPFLEPRGGSVSLRNITGASSEKIARQVAEQYPYATSLHAHGVAVDINPSRNRYGESYSDFDARPEIITDVKAIVTVLGEPVFKWGGDWSNDDDMHFEPTRVTRYRLMKGIDFDSVRGWDEYGDSPDEGDEEMSMKRGDKGEGVKDYQLALKEWDASALPEWGADADFGGETEEWVKRFQEAKNLPQTGVIDGTTAGLLARFMPHTHDGLIDPPPVAVEVT